MTSSFCAGIAADYAEHLATLTQPRKARPMVTLKDLAREAAELRPSEGDALVTVAYSAGQWQIDVYATVPEAMTHCDRTNDLFGVISVRADQLDTATALAMQRVEAAIADTPAHTIAY